MTVMEVSAKPISLVPVGSNVQQYLNQCKELIKFAGYKSVTPEDAVAVCHQESNLNPIFSHDDPLFIQNIGAAYNESKLPRQMIWEAILIKKGPYSGQMSKFRFEPSYWDWAIKQRCNSLQLMLQMACSFGIAQQMMRWAVTPGKPEEWTAYVENFKADTGLQLKFLIAQLDKFLAGNEGDLFKAYKQYNSGDPN